jgi:hypothetical protein
MQRLGKIAMVLLSQRNQTIVTLYRDLSSAYLVLGWFKSFKWSGGMLCLALLDYRRVAVAENKASPWKCNVVCFLIDVVQIL